jgi:general secretion pathway protein D
VRLPAADWKRAAAICAAAAWLSSSAWAGSKAPAPVSMHFVNTEIDAVTRAMAILLNRQFVVDPRVKGTITLWDDRPRPPQEIFGDYLAALRGLGFTVVEVEGLYKVLPEAEAKLQAGVVVAGAPARTGDQVLTQIFRLQHESANNLVPILRPLISPNNTINANAGNNTLVITDYADNLRRVARIIAAVDMPAGGEVELVRLRHAVAADVVPLLQRLFEQPGPGASQPGAPAPAGTAAIQIDPRSNALLLRVPSGPRLTAMRSLIAQLDQPLESNGGFGNVWVVKLKHAESTRVAAVLRATFGSGSGAAGLTANPTPTPTPNSSGPLAAAPGAAPGQGAAAAPVAASPQPSTGGFVQADTATNSLVISAPEPLYRQIRAVIEQLDGRRPQVFIESMIVEVSGDNAADVGFQWQGLLGKSGDKWGVATGTNFGTSGNIVTLSAAESTGEISVGEGLNIALLRDYGSAYGLAAIARLLQSQASTNIVSTPNVITLDNEEAKIVVGSNVPFITGQTQVASAGAATANPFQTIERKDVGITLRIRPQINNDGTVRMTIFQESSSLSEKVAPGTTNAGPSTDKRSIETNVVVDAGQIIVLGGLIEDKYTDRRSKVPVLGDIPWFGALFRSESRTKTRTNLMVFLRPVVMADRDAVDQVSMQRYEKMNELQREAAPPSHPLLKIEPTPVKPPGPPDPTPPTTPD